MPLLNQWPWLLLTVCALLSASCSSDKKSPAGTSNDTAAASTSKAASAPETTSKTSPKPGAAGGTKTPGFEIITLPEDEATPFTLDPSVTTGTLDNGLRYYIRANHNPENRAEFWLSVDAGSFQEDENQRGLAHFVEHMAFNGTEDFPKNELVSKLQSLGVKFGAHLNASTSFDETLYKLLLPTDDVSSIDLGLHILSQWAGSISFTDKDIDEELGVVLAEKRSGDGAQMRLMESVIKDVFEGTRYSKRIPIGLPKVLKTATSATIRKFYKDWYQPGNMAVYVVGDIDLKETEERIKKHFATLSAPKKPRAAPPRKMPKSSGMKFLALSDKELPINAVALARLQPARVSTNLEEYRRDFLEMMTVIMLSKRLEEAQRKGKARYLMAGGAPVPLVRNARVLTFLAMVKPDDPRGGLEDLLTEIERARRFGFTQGEYDRATKDMLSTLESQAAEAAAGKESSNALVSELTRYQLTREIMPGRATEVAIIKRLSHEVAVAEVAGVLENFLDPEGLLVAGISSGGGSISKADVSRLLAQISGKSLIAYADTPADGELLTQEPAAGTISKETEIESLGATEWTLSNGATVLIKTTDFKEDEIVFRAVSPGGTSLVSTEKLAAIQRATEVVARAGLGDHDAIALGRTLAGHNVSMSASVGPYSEALVGSSSREDLESMLKLAYLHFQAPRVDKKSSAIYQQEQVEAARQAHNDPEQRFREKLAGFLSNKNPRVAPWDERAAAAIDEAASRAFYRERFHNASDFRFYIVGNVDRKVLRPLVLRYLASISSDGSKEQPKIAAWPSYHTSALLKKRDGTQPRANLTFLLSRDVDPRLATQKTQLVWQILGSAMQMRLMEVFREQMGATYGVGLQAGWSQRFSKATMRIGFQCAPQREEELRKAAIKEIKRLAIEGVSADHFAKAKKTLSEGLEISYRDNDNWISMLAERDLNHWPESYIAKRQEIAESIGPADLITAAKALLNVDAIAVAVLLPKKK